MEYERKTYSCDSFAEVNEVLEIITKDVGKNTQDIECIKKDIHVLKIEVNKSGFIDSARKEFTAFMSTTTQLQRNVELFAEHYPQLVKHIDSILELDVDSIQRKTDAIMDIDLDDIIERINEIKHKLIDHDETISTYIGSFESQTESIVESKTPELNTDGTIIAIKDKIKKSEIIVNKPPPVVEQTPLTVVEFIAREFCTNPVVPDKGKKWTTYFLSAARINNMRKNEEFAQISDSIKDKKSDEYYQVIAPYYWESVCATSAKSVAKKLIDTLYAEYVENFKLCVQEQLNNNL
jgi:hypothetical protein